MSRAITATYRLQLRREFPLTAACQLVPYFHSLGVSHLYLSPVLAARPGSAHGYDVIDPARLNPELGSDEDFRSLAHALHERGMGIVLDIVPNHMAASEHNPYWDNVLERGQDSRYAEWFDIDWSAPRGRARVVLPVLGDEPDRVIERGELTLHVRDSGSRIAYSGKTFPLDPATLPKELQLAQWDPAGRPALDEWMAGPAGRERLRALLDAQHYQLVFWRRIGELNYRRFFDVTDLVSLRMESDAVFEPTHRRVLQWVRDGLLDGLRIDHVDGLRSPAWYLSRLRAECDAARHPDAPARFPIFVEKILSGDEQLPSDWPVEGTTGYDFMGDVEDLFLEPRGFTALEAAYRGLRRNPSLQFAAIAEEGKRRALSGALWPDVMRAARVAQRWRFSASAHEIAEAIVEFLVHLDVYRSYVDEPGLVSKADERVLRAALRASRASDRVNHEAVKLLEDAFFAAPNPGDRLRAELVSRIQQVAGPATAKGVEDTALYVYVPLASRNEVGGDPERTLTERHRRVHARNAARSRDWPRTMLATDTHDTKRSADVRSRLDVLTALPEQWLRHVNRWRRLNKPLRQVVRGKPTPDTNAEYLFYQTVFGVWPAPRPERRADDLPGHDWLENAAERLVAYMRKAVREAKTRTSWTESDPEYEQALLAFVKQSLTPRAEEHFLPDLARLTALTSSRAFAISLARALIHLTAPGIPDIYQGSECWNFALVDPDNRAPVDFDRRRDLLEAIDGADADIAAVDPSRFFENRVKLRLIARLLRARREHSNLFIEGDYLPLEPTSSSPDQSVFAFLRRWRDQRALSIARTGIPPDNASDTLADSIALDATTAANDDFTGEWISTVDNRRVDLLRDAVSSSIRVNGLYAHGYPCDLLLRRQS